MGLFKGLLKGIGSKVNDTHTNSQINRAGEKAFDKTGKEIRRATQNGEYLGRQKCREIFLHNKEKNINKAKSNGKARDRFLDGL